MRQQHVFILGIDVDKWDYFLRDKEYLKVNELTKANNLSVIEIRNRYIFYFNCP